MIAMMRCFSAYITLDYAANTESVLCLFVLTGSLFLSRQHLRDIGLCVSPEPAHTWHVVGAQQILWAAMTTSTHDGLKE